MAIRGEDLVESGMSATELAREQGRAMTRLAERARDEVLLPRPRALTTDSILASLGSNADASSFATYLERTPNVVRLRNDRLRFVQWCHQNWADILRHSMPPIRSTQRPPRREVDA